MWKIYFRQAIQMLRQNSFISTISILGTAVAIMMIMAIIVSDEIKSVNLAPEINRSRTLYISTQSLKDTVKNSVQNGWLTYETIHNYIPKLTRPVKKAIVSAESESKLAVLNVEGSQVFINATQRITNADYWDVFKFNFTEGRPYNEDEVFSGIRYAILAQSLAQRLFPGTTALNQTIEINFQPYTVLGVVKDIQPIFNHAYSEVWLPYTSDEDYKNWRFEALLLGNHEDDFPGIISEVRECEKQYGRGHQSWMLSLRGPANRKVYNMNFSRNYGYSAGEVAQMIKANNRKRVFILCVLLLIPAINLSGLSMSRIKKRTSEIGVRKAFGAKRYVILLQVLYENFITSLIGGLIGLILSYAVVFRMREWLLGIPGDSSIPIGALVSPLVFLIVFLACMIINLLSAGVPAFRASRTTIINSLNQNEKKS